MDISTLDRRLQDVADLLLENGWQPADLAHFARRGGNVRDSRLMVGLLARHARTHDALGRAPEQWIEQLSELGAIDRTKGVVVGGHAQVLGSWGKSESLHPDDLVTAALDVLDHLTKAPRLRLELPRPSEWPLSNKGRVDPSLRPVGEVDAKALRTIRALLAKAEATEFEAESATFTEKAQQLMTRHSIDLAVLAAAAAGLGTSQGVASRRVHIENPYAEEKSVLLHVIAEVNGARTIWLPAVGIATLMGFPVDIQLTDVMFTSLLLQAQRFSAEATAHDRRSRTPRFRRAFFLAFADRVAERLEASRRRATAEAAHEYGSALAPVLARKSDAVTAAYEEAFPHATVRPARRVDAAGWHAGRAAADRADLGAVSSLPHG